MTPPRWGLRGGTGQGVTSHSTRAPLKQRLGFSWACWMDVDPCHREAPSPGVGRASGCHWPGSGQAAGLQSPQHGRIHQRRGIYRHKKRVRSLVWGRRGKQLENMIRHVTEALRTQPRGWACPVVREPGQAGAEPSFPPETGTGHSPPQHSSAGGPLHAPSSDDSLQRVGQGGRWPEHCCASNTGPSTSTEPS